MNVNTELTTRVEGRRNGYVHSITHQLGKSLELDPVWDTVELDSTLFTQKRFFRIVGSELFERLLRLMEPIGELEMLFPIVASPIISSK